MSRKDALTASVSREKNIMEKINKGLIRSIQIFQPVRTNNRLDYRSQILRYVLMTTKVKKKWYLVWRTVSERRKKTKVKIEQSPKQ